MDALKLPAPADSLWRRAAKALHDLLKLVPDDRETYRMGGGTVLAARWGHRKSTDIDLWLPEGTGMTIARRGRNRKSAA